MFGMMEMRAVNFQRTAFRAESLEAPAHVGDHSRQLQLQALVKPGLVQIGPVLYLCSGYLSTEEHIRVVSVD